MLNGVLGLLTSVCLVLSRALGPLMTNILPALIIIGPSSLGTEEEGLVEMIVSLENPWKGRVGDLGRKKAAVGKSVKAVGAA